MIKTLLIAALLLISVPLFSQQIFTLNEHGEAASRTFDVVHYRIEVSIDEQNKSVSGNTTITFVPLLPQFHELRLHAREMSIASVLFNGKETVSFEYDSSTLWISLNRSYSPGDTLSVAIAYACTPKKSLTFTGPDPEYPSRRWQIWSQGEDTLNRYWFPGWDFPNDRVTSEVIGTVNAKFTLLSNGKLISVKENKTAGAKTFHWKQTKPHVSYLIMIAAGEYAVLTGQAGNVPLSYYVYPDDTLNARIAFRETPEMLKFFNELTGFPYPWEKYAQIILQDHFGGMENTGAVTLSDTWAVPDERMRIDNTHNHLIAHELAHQWWGNVVTCKDFRHLWLNESFASYFDPLYVESTRGRDEFDYRLYMNQNSGIAVDSTQGRKPVVSEGTYGTNVYPRGSAILHMLRFLLGDQLFFKSLRHYISKHQFQSVETNDFKIAIEEATGQNLYWFFDQWLYKAGHPVFDVSYAWSDYAKAVFLTVKQTQTIDSLTGIFRMPVDIEIVTESGAASVHRIHLLQQDSIYAIPCREKPRMVIFDKGNWLLKELNFRKPVEEFSVQAKTALNPIDRIRALTSLARDPNAEQFTEVFTDRIQNDKFWAVRRDAILEAGKIVFTDESMKELLKASLLSALNDQKSSVRAAAAEHLKNFRGTDVVVALTLALKDSSYYVVEDALRSLVKVDSVYALPLILEHLEIPSFTNRIHNAALRALSPLDSTTAVDVALKDARHGNLTNTRWTALGILRKYGKSFSTARTLFESLLTDKNSGIRSYAASALGEIGDEITLPLLEAVASEPDNDAAESAKKSVEKIKERISKETK